MSAQHTPGRWEFYTKPQPNGCPIVGSSGLMIAMLAHSINHTEQRETAIANARLIAAAPELLMALKELLGPYVDKPSETTGMMDLLVCGEDIDAARAAIAKSIG